MKTVSIPSFVDPLALKTEQVEFLDKLWQRIREREEKGMRLAAATRNPAKLGELQRMLEGYGIEVISQAELCPELEVEETGATFAENAALKARGLLQASGLAAIADDSGLCVDALDGAPGIYSARYAGEHATDEERNQKLLAELREISRERRTGRFVSAVCCVFPDGTEIACKGVCEGWIGFAPRGKDGFGYDPLFMVGEKSFAEMTPAEKDAVSHRGKALELLERRLREYLDSLE